METSVHPCVVCHGTALPGCRNCGGTGQVTVYLSDADDDAPRAVAVSNGTNGTRETSACAVEIGEADQMTIGYLQDLIKSIETGQELDLLQGALRDMAQTYARIAELEQA